MAAKVAIYKITYVFYLLLNALESVLSLTKSHKTAKMKAEAYTTTPAPGGLCILLFLLFIFEVYST